MFRIRKSLPIAGTLLLLAGLAFAGPKAGTGTTPYPLPTCVVSGKTLGDMGEPHVVKQGGNVVQLCCKGCVAKLTASPEKYLASLKRAVVKQQLPAYPLTKCLVSGKPLDTKGKPVDVVVKNRLLRVCCKDCAVRAKKYADGGIAKVDKAVLKVQAKRYPLKSCPVSGKKLGSMGKPVSIVMGTRLVNLCCAGCKPKAVSGASEVLKKIDEALLESQRASYPLQSCPVSGGKLGSMGDPVEKLVGTTLVKLCCAGCEEQLLAEPAKFVAKVAKAREGQ